MSFFKKKEKATLDQFIYQTIIQIEDIIMENECKMDLSDELNSKINELLLFGSFIYMNFKILDKKTGITSEELGKRTTEALIYYYEKNEYNREYITRLLDSFMDFYEQFELFVENNEKEGKVENDELFHIYMFVNKTIGKEEELNITSNNYNDQEIIRKNGIIAEYSKLILKEVEDVVKQLFNFYEITDVN